MWIVVVGGMVAGFVQGLSGFGFGLMALAFWAWSLDPVVVGPLVVFGSLICQLLSIGTIRKSLNLRRAAPFVAGGVLGVPIGVFLLRHIDPVTFKFCVGLLLVVWCPVMLFARQLPHVTGGGRLADAAVGMVGGVMGGLGGLTGPAPTLWAALRGWERDAQRAVFQVFNLSMHSVTIIVYFSSGTVPDRALPLFLPLAVCVVIPTLIGARLYRRFSDLAFRRVVLGLLTVSGVILLAITIPRL